MDCREDTGADDPLKVAALGVRTKTNPGMDNRDCLAHNPVRSGSDRLPCLLRGWFRLARLAANMGQRSAYPSSQTNFGEAAPKRASPPTG
jgi:hypothetical protein